MTEQLEQTALEGVDQFFTKITEAGEIIANKLLDVSPDVAEGLLTLVQYKGGFDIFFDVLFFLFSCTTLVVFLKIRKKIFDFDDTLNSYDRGVLKVLWAVGAIIAFVVTTLSFFFIFNFYNWVAVIYPEGAVAIKALEMVGVSL